MAFLPNHLSLRGSQRQFVALSHLKKREDDWLNDWSNDWVRNWMGNCFAFRRWFGCGLRPEEAGKIQLQSRPQLRYWGRGQSLQLLSGIRMELISPRKLISGQPNNHSLRGITIVGITIRLITCQLNTLNVHWYTILRRRNPAWALVKQICCALKVYNAGGNILNVLNEFQHQQQQMCQNFWQCAKFMAIDPCTLISELCTNEMLTNQMSKMSKNLPSFWTPPATDSTQPINK